jgi:hypothetical protein
MRVESGEAHATRPSVAPEQVQAQTPVGEQVFHAAPGPQPQRDEPDPLPQQPPETAGRRLAGTELPARELPEAAEEPSRRPADREEAAPAPEQRGDALDRPGRGPRSPHRQRLGLAALAGAAGAGDGAVRAARAAWLADGGAELHQRLVQVAGARAARELPRRLPEPGLRRGPPQVVADPEQPCEDARDVAVDDRLRSIERDRGHRPRRVAPDSGQLAQGRRVVGQAPAVPLDQRARRALEVARARVVAEARPQPEHRVGLRPGEARDVREAREEALVVGDHRLDARLLQHRFGDPDGVGIARTPPREVAAVGPVPVEQPPANLP